MTVPNSSSPVDAQPTPVRCTACGHTRIPARYCANPDCRHLEEFHAFNSKNTIRTACSVSTGRKAVRCPCKSFTELPKETSQ